MALCREQLVGGGFARGAARLRYLASTLIPTLDFVTVGWKVESKSCSRDSPNASIFPRDLLLEISALVRTIESL